MDHPVHRWLCSLLVATSIVGCAPKHLAAGASRLGDDAGVPRDGATSAQDGATSTAPDAGDSCRPGHSACADGVAEVCRPDGTLWRFECDPVQGMECTPGGCRGVCSPTSLRASYVGCDYFPTVTLNPVWSEFHFGVAVASTTPDATHVTVTRGTEVIAERTVAGSGLEIIELPWVPELKGGDFGASTQSPDWGASSLVAGGAYRLRSDRPVTVYQFSPLEYTLGDVDPTCPGHGHGSCNSYSNDASLLLPVNSLGTRYTTVAWPSTQGGGSLVAVTATEDDTTVTVAGRGGVRAGGGIDAEGSGTITLDRGDVLQILADAPTPPASLFAPEEFGPDVTGTRVTSDKPVQVIAGQGCANVPEPRTGYCDHLEEAMFPVLTLDADYFVPSILPPEDGARQVQVVRVVAAYPGEDTVVRFDPPVTAEVTLNADRPFVELRDVTRDLRVQASAPVLVSHVMQGSSTIDPGAAEPRGDPAHALAVPVRQFRSQYRFYSSLTYDRSFVSIVAPMGTSVTLDGVVLDAGAFVEVSATGFGVASRELSGDVHELTAARGVGITVYGYGAWTSYMYPGGLDLLQGPI